MAGDIPADGPGSAPVDGISKLSLATRTVHADDGISAQRDVAPAMHVSTTFKYNRDPDTLRSAEEVDVSHPPRLCTHLGSLLAVPRRRP